MSTDSRGPSLCKEDKDTVRGRKEVRHAYIYIYILTSGIDQQESSRVRESIYIYRDPESRAQILTDARSRCTLYIYRELAWRMPACLYLLIEMACACISRHITLMFIYVCVCASERAHIYTSADILPMSTYSFSLRRLLQIRIYRYITPSSASCMSPWVGRAVYLCSQLYYRSFFFLLTPSKFIIFFLCFARARGERERRGIRANWHVTATAAWGANALFEVNIYISHARIRKIDCCCVLYIYITKFRATCYWLSDKVINNITARADAFNWCSDRRCVYVLYI